MRWIVNYIRSLFCKHDFEHLISIDLYERSSDTMPCGHKYVYRCKKCGYTQKIRV